MSKGIPTKKEIFTALGSIQMVEDAKGIPRKRFVPNSVAYINDNISRLAVGKKLSSIFYEERMTRSRSQLKYHMVLMGYLAEYAGTSKEEMHDAVMRLKFGTKEVVLMGMSTRVRRSVSDAAMMQKYDMVELINYDLELCAWAEIKVPTAEELGYQTADEK